MIISPEHKYRDYKPITFLMFILILIVNPSIVDGYIAIEIK